MYLVVERSIDSKLGCNYHTTENFSKSLSMVKLNTGLVDPCPNSSTRKELKNEEVRTFVTESGLPNLSVSKRPC